VLIQRGAEVVGIELDPIAAKAAEQKGLRVLQGDAAAVSAALREEWFDCLIYADVLEHLPDPLALLSAHVQHLQVGGQVIVSVPNFRNYKVFWHLFVKGRIPSWDEGIFDRTHLRITTRKLVLDWFDACGLEPTRSRYPIYGRRDRLVSAGLLGLAREFIAVQVILAGIKK
jgi:SAM-dependent methyltransferase